MVVKMGEFIPPTVGDEIHFADPFKQCKVCLKRVTGVTVVDVGAWPNLPCGHVGYDDSCPSWSPVDGCTCEKSLGYMPHPETIPT
jgi:hypothetical protein